MIRWSVSMALCLYGVGMSVLRMACILYGPYRSYVLHGLWCEYSEQFERYGILEYGLVVSGAGIGYRASSAKA